MKLASYAPFVAAVIIVGGIAASGLVDLTDQPADRSDIGEGELKASDVSLPETATLQRDRHGGGVYYLRVPDATVRIDRLSGQPILTYKIRIPQLGHSRESAFFVDENSEERLSLSLEKDTLPPEEITAESYDGELRVVVRSNDGSRVLERRNITVQVQE